MGFGGDLNVLFAKLNLVEYWSLYGTKLYTWLVLWMYPWKNNLEKLNFGSICQLCSSSTVASSISIQSIHFFAHVQAYRTLRNRLPFEKDVTASTKLSIITYEVASYGMLSSILKKLIDSYNKIYSHEWNNFV